MEHRHIHDKLVMSNDPELSAAERQAILAHEHRCNECSVLARRWRNAQLALRSAAAPDASEAFVEAVMRRLPAEVTQPAPLRWATPAWLVPRLAIGLAGMLLALILADQESTILGTETLLLAGMPDGAAWEFAADMPDAALLLNTTTESP